MGVVDVHSSGKHRLTDIAKERRNVVSCIIDWGRNGDPPSLLSTVLPSPEAPVFYFVHNSDLNIHPGGGGKTVFRSRTRVWSKKYTLVVVISKVVKNTCVIQEVYPCNGDQRGEEGPKCGDWKRNCPKMEVIQRMRAMKNMWRIFSWLEGEGCPQDWSSAKSRWLCT